MKENKPNKKILITGSSTSVAFKISKMLKSPVKSAYFEQIFFTTSIEILEKLI